MDSAIIGKTTVELDLRENHGISIITLKRGDQNITAPDRHIGLQAGGLLFVIQSRDDDG